MNLHGIVAPVIGAINPNIPVTLRKSTGYAIGAGGVQEPQYAADQPMRGQVQPMSWRDLQQTEGLNLNGTRRKIYLYGTTDGVVRSLRKGGDLIIIETGGVNDGTWLVAQVLEQFADWVSCACTLQNS